MHTQDFLIIVLAFAAELIGTASGVSSSVLFVPLASLFVEPRTVLGYTATLHIIGNSIRLVMYFSHIEWRLAVKIGIPAVIFTAIGAVLSSYLDQKFFSALLGFFLIVFSFLMLSSERIIKKMSEIRSAPYVGGVLSGLLTGLVGSGGAIRSLSLSVFQLTPLSFTATSTLIDFGGDIFRFFIYMEQGYLEAHHYLFLPLVVVGVFFANWLAKQWLKRITPQRFRKIILLLVFVMGIISFVKAVAG